MSDTAFAPPGQSLFTAQVAPPIVSVVPSVGQGVALGTSRTIPAQAATTPSSTDSVVPEAHTTSNGYADPNVSGGAGPELSDLPDGTYAVFFGGSGGGDFAANVTYYMAVSVNGATPIDSNACEFASDRGNTSGGRMIVVSVMKGGNNTFKCVYRSSDGTDRGNIRYRWISALRLGDISG